MPTKPPPAYRLEYVLHPERDPYVRFAGAAAHPFVADPPSGVPPVNAWWLAEAALTSYADAPQAAATYASAGLASRFVSHDDTDAYLAWNDTAVIVAFRGTEPDRLRDNLSDANLFLDPWRHGPGRVHIGFRTALDRVWDPLMAALSPLAPGRQVWFCGHSLGAALATLAAVRYPGTRGACTFGAPRIGDPAFAAGVDSRLGDRALRFVNHHDIVTHVPLPPAFRHVGGRRVIDGSGTVTTTAPAIPHFFGTLVGSPEQLGHMLVLLDGAPAPFAPQCLLDHMPSAYATALWNDFNA